MRDAPSSSSGPPAPTVKRRHEKPARPANRADSSPWKSDGDLLSQWRGYGDDGRGVAIGFRKPTILRCVRRHRGDAILGELLRFGPVYYREMDNALQSCDKNTLRQERFLLRRLEVTRGHLFREDEMGAIDRLIFELLVVVHEPVPHPGDFRQRDLTAEVDPRLAELPGLLAYGLDRLHHGPLGCKTPPEALRRDLAGAHLALELGGVLVHEADPVLVAHAAQSATASPMTLSRNGPGSSSETS